MTRAGSQNAPRRLQLRHGVEPASLTVSVKIVIVAAIVAGLEVALALRQQPPKIAQRILAAIETKDFEPGSTCCRPVALRIVTRVQHLLRRKTADFERPPVNQIGSGLSAPSSLDIKRCRK